MLLVRLTSGPPVIYRQRRTGLEGKEYVLLKIRTMRPDAEDGSGAVWARAADRRITRVGHFLRKWRIDEIPQLVNVLRGEMSLVGPRPERPEFVEMLSEAIPFYRERLLVRPGITGWAQVNYPYGASVEAARRKLQYDLYYIKNMSFFVDVLILLRTFRTIIEGLRYSEELAAALDEIGEEEVIHASLIGPGELFFYGIHLTDVVNAVMGGGVEGVSNLAERGFDLINITFGDGRSASLQLLREARGQHQGELFTAGLSVRFVVRDRIFYRRTMERFLAMVETGEPPIRYEDMIEAVAVLVAADISASQGGRVVRLAELRPAREQMVPSLC